MCILTILNAKRECIVRNTVWRRLEWNFD